MIDAVAAGAVVVVLSNPFGDLPEGLSEPLHLLRPWSSCWLVAAVALLLLALVVWRLRRRRRVVKPPSAPASRWSPAPAGGPLTLIQDIRRRYRDALDLRPGFDELSALLRGLLAGQLTRPPSPSVAAASLTAAEVAARLDDAAAAKLLQLLARHQFGRQEPTADDLDSACNLTLEVVAVRMVRRTGRTARPPAAGHSTPAPPAPPERTGS
jgi:hypothetical protein